MIYETLVWLIPLPPLVAFALIVLFTRQNRAASHWTALVGAGLSWLGSMVVFVRAVTTPELSKHPIGNVIPWLPMGKDFLNIGVQIDPLSAVVLFFVAWTVLMIFIYSVGYHNFGQPESEHDHPGLPPHGATVKVHKNRERVPSVEPMYSRFFAFICLFAFGMFLLVVTDNLLLLYVGWEIMGLCSYLLIGFWYAKPSARDAAVKAFLTTRIGDMFMMIGLAALFSVTGSLSYQKVLSDPLVLEKLASSPAPILGLSWAGFIGLMLFMGTVGKSAQFPLHIWLPDAMEGPTPVSAMIHAATMVSAGVYLVIRFFPLISAGWEPGQALTPPMFVMALIGAFTALFAATIALAQNDIKRVLAYSTISQLGYMIAALGIGAYTAAVFHLVTHAFFKALLFLGSGSVIHGMEHGVLHTNEEVDPQDMLNMGGLKDKLPVTFWTFLIGGLALSGFPLVTAGFWSKDEILSGAFNGGYILVFVTLGLAALLTAFYTMRQISLTFLGKARTQSAEHAHEPARTMTIPLVILSVFAVSAGWAGIPKSFPFLGGLSSNWFGGFVGSMMENLEHAGTEGHSYVPLLTSLVVSLGGLFLGWWVYRDHPAGKEDPLASAAPGLHRILKNKYYLDELYQLIFIRPALWFAEKISYQLIDQKILDGILHGIAAFGSWSGRLLRTKFDLPVVNWGLGDVWGETARDSSVLLRRLQTGRIQQYMTIAVMLLVVLGAVLFYFFGV
jgi:NADH-quinone oxidoreductase subunit L